MSDERPFEETALPPRPRLTWRESIREPDAFGFALILIVLSVGVMAVGGDQSWARFVVVGILSSTLLFLLWTTRASRRVQRAAVVAIVVLIVMGAIAVAVDDPVLENVIALGMAAALAVAAPVIIARALIRHPVVTFRTILGAMCLYVLIGLFFAVVFKITGRLDPPFFAQIEVVTSADYVYFSYVTLATLGYGDLTPAQDIGRMLAVTCALMGQLYLVSILALLVANVGKARRRRTPDAPSDDDPGERVSNP